MQLETKLRPGDTVSFLNEEDPNNPIRYEVKELVVAKDGLWVVLQEKPGQRFRENEFEKH